MAVSLRKPGPPLTLSDAQQRELLRRYLYSKETVSEIAAAFRISRTAVYNYLERMGVKSGRPGEEFKEAS